MLVCRRRLLGTIKVKGENDADPRSSVCKITAKIKDATDGTEDGIIEFANRKAGSMLLLQDLQADSLQLLNGTNLTVDGTVIATHTQVTVVTLQV